MQEGINIKEDRYKIVGLTSWGQHCYKTDPDSGIDFAWVDIDRSPKVLTRVSSFVDWIKKYAKNTQTIYTNNLN